MSGFDPYTYNPMMRHYYNGAPLPQEMSKIRDLIANHPAESNHINAVYQFGQWMKTSEPELYAAIINNRPDLLDPGSVVLNRVISPQSGLSGMGEMQDDSSLSSWGQQIADFAQQYLILRQQKDLMDMNIKRAEQGLPPIDNVGAAVNVGMTQDVKNLAYAGLIGFGIIAGLAIISRNKR